MAFASFVHTNGSITFTRGSQRPDQSLDIVQPQRTTPGGVRFGYTQTITRQIIKLPLRMTTDQKEQFLTFFNITVNAMAETFIYTDPTGNAFLVRFATPTLDGLTEKTYNAWELTVELRIAT